MTRITQNIILPPACIGILGGGQLGMMLAQIAKQFGYKVAILEPDKNCPARPFCDIHIAKAYDDKDGLKELGQLCAVVTTEFENVPAESVNFINQITPVYPSASAILISQNRLKEKTFFRSLGLGTADFHKITQSHEYTDIDPGFFPAILKTTTLGYDGKGQCMVHSNKELISAFNSMHTRECILEKKVALKEEVSIIAARNQTGIKLFPLISNHHKDGILDVSYIPARVSQKIMEEAKKAANLIIEALDYIGILTIEFFVTEDDELLINEIAPRPHNSGHITVTASKTSQFEQQLRAVCGLNLGDTELISSGGAMLNLLGNVWLDNKSPEQVILQTFPNAKIYNYGKAEAKIGRKMGHVSILGDQEELIDTIKELKIKLNLA